MLQIVEIDWGLWLATMVPLIFSAGPGNVMVAASAAQSGLCRSLPFIAGLDGTYFLLALSVGFGLSQILTEYASVTAYLRVLGILYIFWLAFRFLLSHPSSAVAGSRDLGAVDGITVQLTNTKGMIMLMVMFGEFSGPDIGDSITIVLMSSLLVILNFIAHLLWGSFGVAISASLVKNPLLYRFQNFIFAAMLFGVGVWLSIR